MERGPLALFGAIVSVGLGPALWLGAQLGAVNLAPSQRPAPVNEQFPGVDMDFGGAGAGDPAADPVSTYPFTPYAPPTSTAPVKRKQAAPASPTTLEPVQPSPPRASPSSSPSSPASPASPAGPSPSTAPVSSPSPSPECSESETGADPSAR
ncbi:hypothetical protein GCM10010112_31650 [Actinoplanes lobatus]|uniref:Uncharacterized protein n=1 Tax=Actinoplanes lobatus TaxID=113568 RepID=A0A7W7MG00_9ACTN|nr:hypothetical protein [Actinoplanes lobatus]MBB4748879.1 hypothetical protein [Actinoplanes lobatus]GGN67852.1 hypothetical protein GCM10010112_31650 [Actinoplanes lobatus]GIE37213.1 hypothetical protein Alo02nite_01110 [Actinoplanes lobatus]